MTISDDVPPAAEASDGPDPIGEAAARIDARLAVLEHTPALEERAPILVAIAIDLRDGLHDDAQALDALIEAWRADPTNHEILDHLEPLAGRYGRWDELFEVTRSLIATERAPNRALALSEAIVRWSMRTERSDLAHQYLEHVRLIDPTHWLVHLFQAAKYEQHGDAARELEELDRAVMSARRADDRARIHVMMANRYMSDRAANTAEAKRHFSAALALTPSKDALAGLERIYDREGDLPALAEVLEKEILAIDAEDEQVKLLLRLAEIYEKQFLKPDMAAEKLERAFALDPSNERVLADLERCYTAMRSWDDLVRILEGAIALIDDPEERAERLLALAEIFESRMGDLAGAISAYERLEKLLPDDETLIGELARLTEKKGDLEAAAQHRAKLAELSTDPRTRARMHAMAGQLLLPKDPIGARAHFESAVELDPTQTAAWNTLLSEARKSGDSVRLAGYLAKRAATVEGPRAQAQIFAELGEVQQAAGDDASALAAWEAAFAVDPNNEAAARALLTAYVKSERWQEAAPLCDLVLHAAERARDPERLFTARRQVCLVSGRVGRWGRALATAVSAFEMRPEASGVAESLIECAWNMRADPQVLDALQALDITADRPKALSNLSPDTRSKLGEVLAATGERERAMAIFESVLGEQPDNATALRGLSGLRAARGESIAAWTLKRQLAETVDNDDERYQMLLETAEGFATKAKRHDLAAESYEKARTIRPKDHVLLHKLLAEYQTLEDWTNVFGVLRTIADADQDSARKAKVVMTMGHVAQSKLDGATAAVQLYEEALDLDPSRLDAFERIAQILTGLEDWQGLEHAYRRMLVRARNGGDSRLHHALLCQLGLLYRDFLRDAERAITAFRAAAELRPEDEPTQTALRELLARAGRADDALALTFDRVKNDVLDPAPYPVLFDLLVQVGQIDRAWCVASIMDHLGGVSAGGVELLEARPPPAIDQIGGNLGIDGYRWVLHPDLDPTLTTIFEVMASAAVEVHLAQLSFRERLAHPGPSFTRSDFLNGCVKGICRILGLPPARLFTSKGPPAIGVGVTRPPSLLVHAESLAGFPLSQLAFWVAKRLAELTPPLLAHALFRSVGELKDLVASAARIVQGKSDKQHRTDEQLRGYIGKARFRDLAMAIDRAVSMGGALDVRRWSQLADLSAARAGLVIVGDIETVRRAIVREGQSPGDLAPDDQMRDLIAFFLSDEYSQIRAKLGITVTVR